MENQFYTVDEFAKIWRVDPRTVRKAIKSGRILGVRVDERSPYRIPHSQIERLHILSSNEIEKDKI